MFSSYEAHDFDNRHFCEASPFLDLFPVHHSGAFYKVKLSYSDEFKKF